LVRRLTLPREAQRVVVDSGEPWRLAIEAVGQLPDDGLPSVVADVLDALSAEVITIGVAGVADSPERDAVLRYLHEHRAMTPELDGEAVLALGCADGPAVGDVLRALRRARIDGEVTDLAGERALAERLVGTSN